MVHTSRIEVNTRGQGDIRDLSAEVTRAIESSGLRDGIVTVFVTGSTAGITTIEFEPGAVADLGAMFERLVPCRAEYEHHLRWGDDNGSSHVRAALLGPSITVPVVAGRPCTGTWQQIVLAEFDTRARRREVVVQVLGE